MVGADGQTRVCPVHTGCLSWGTRLTLGGSEPKAGSTKHRQKGIHMGGYESPKVTELGSLDELTLTKIHKNTGTGDVIIINSQVIPVPGTTVTSVSK